jgi:hypothetical protein
MSQTFGMEAPRKHTHSPLQAPARYLVVIDSGGYMVARLFLANREQVAEFDAAAEDVAAMTSNLAAETGALGAEWDVALRGHSPTERAEAKIYRLAV